MRETKAELSGRLQASGQWPAAQSRKEGIRRQFRANGVGKREANARAWGQIAVEYASPSPAQQPPEPAIAWGELTPCHMGSDIADMMRSGPPDDASVESIERRTRAWRRRYYELAAETLEELFGLTLSDDVRAELTDQCDYLVKLLIEYNLNVACYHCGGGDSGESGQGIHPSPAPDTGAAQV